jgi:hypothetical protein
VDEDWPAVLMATLFRHCERSEAISMTRRSPRPLRGLAMTARGASPFCNTRCPVPSASGASRAVRFPSCRWRSELREVANRLGGPGRRSRRAHRGRATQVRSRKVSSPGSTRSAPCASARRGGGPRSERPPAVERLSASERGRPQRGIRVGLLSFPRLTKVTSASVTFTCIPGSLKRLATTSTRTVIDVFPILTSSV